MAPGQTDVGSVPVPLQLLGSSVCGCVAGCLSEEQRSQLLQRFKLLCIAGLQSDGAPADSNESTLIRCNCCYNLPVPAHTRQNL